MKRLLLISYWFPPDGGAGAQRPTKFCKYLPQFGWAPTVVTRSLHRERVMWDWEDRSLERDITDVRDVIRVVERPIIPDWVKGLPNIDYARHWLGPAWEATSRAVRDEGADAIMITMSPFDLAFLGIRAARELAVPVILDLRDPWALDGWRVRPHYWAWRRDFRAMRKALRSAAAVVVNTPEARHATLEAFHEIDPKTVVTIPNGYDAEDFEAKAAFRTLRNPNRFTLLHAGMLHTYWMARLRGIRGHLRRLKLYRPEPIDVSGRTLIHLFDAINRLAKRGHPLIKTLQISLVGQIDEVTRQGAEAAKLLDIVRFQGYLTHQASVAALCEADALFLPLHGLSQGRRSRIVPGKTYEYLASGRPILGCLPEGDARDLVERSGRGYLASPTNADDIAGALDRLYRDWSAGRHDGGEPMDWVAGYERRRLTADLVKVLDAVSRSQESVPILAGTSAEG